MFPYPSGVGLHVGHPLGYIATDIICRYKRMRGFNVLHPMGFDAFGLPAEQFAVEHGVHPRVTTDNNIANMVRQLKALGLSYDWSRRRRTREAPQLPTGRRRARLGRVERERTGNGALGPPPGLHGRGAGQLVPGPGDRAGQ
ncbi:MAG: class I tRNA ligase family protein [Planctomycetota bacterium]|jgi:hypothetical protein